MSHESILIDVKNVSKRYDIYHSPRDRLKQIVLPPLQSGLQRSAATFGYRTQTTLKNYYREFWALHDVSLQVRRGETLGIIGRNGSGKSTLLQLIAGTLAPTSGSVVVAGRIAALLELGSGFSPDFTGKENVYMNARILGLTEKEIAARYEQIVEFADIGEFIDQPVKTYSSGMFLRLAFAVQAHIDANIVIIDEALAVGDIFFRQRCYARLDLLKNSGAAILLVSHSMPDIEQHCERAILLDHGIVQFSGSSSEAAKHYYLLHQPKRDVKTSNSSSKMSSPLNREESSQLNKIALIDISKKAQIGNGQARCTGVAVCDESGAPCNSFQQGSKAIFYYEFELLDDIEVPICGLTISNERGIIVHGKNNLQFADDAPKHCAKGSRVHCRQEIQLDIATGEYTFEIGLATVDQELWEHRNEISYTDMEGQITRICHMPNAGSFFVGLAGPHAGSLNHHGVANLPGSLEVSLLK